MAHAEHLFQGPRAPCHDGLPFTADDVAFGIERAPNDRYINDAQITQAVAQMLSRIGIETEVDTMPRSTYFGRASALEFSLILVGWGSGTGEASSPLKSLLVTHDKDRGFGASNRGRYFNPDVDALPIKGEIPSPLTPPSGCHFHPRCPHAMPRCSEEAPALKEFAPGRLSACHLNDG